MIISSLFGLFWLDLFHAHTGLTNYLWQLLKVYTSSFSIKAALGNLKISDDSLLSSHPYFWVCDMRNPGGRSFVEVFHVV